MVVRTSDQRHATSSAIGEYIKSKYINLKTVYKPDDILRDMRDDHGIKMSYSKAYRLKVVAQEMVRGKPDDFFSLIPSYLYMLMVANPSSFVKLELKDDNIFLYVFMVLNASIKEWEFYIPVILVDDTFLTLAYGGKLLTTCAQDGNGKIFPLAFCIVDSENDESWEWFMKRIRDAFQMRSDMCIVSDRHENIKNAAIAVFLEVSHALCTFYLFNNIKRKFKKLTKQLRESFYGAAKAYTTEAFDYYMKQLDNMCRGLKTYLQAVSNSNDNVKTIYDHTTKFIVNLKERTCTHVGDSTLMKFLAHAMAIYTQKIKSRSLEILFAVVHKKKTILKTSD
ncbi:uncharacterized protein LOC126678426 [Mercurialis annua]|uniref:uncharacterized protein LOC126678426 n=1 Tax=Mercurialis annua TaxID=3986 RepID=UPI00215E306D|nr:uncharacterized protein LOC126678426 [Mercurialis annua]